MAAARSTRRPRSLTGVAIFLVFASVVGVLWFGAHDVLAGTHDAAAQLSQFVLYAVFGASALGQLSRGLERLRRRPARPGASASSWRCSRRIVARRGPRAAAGAGARRGHLRGRGLRLSDPAAPTPRCTT